MESIYTQAQRVVVWLGEVNSAFDAAISIMSRFVELPPAEKEEEFDLPEWEESEMRLIRNTSTLAYVDVPWFQRKWTLQEIVLAPSALVVTDRREVDWRRLEDWSNGHLPRKSHPSGIETEVRAITDIKKSIHNMPLRTSEVLFRTRTRAATDPRDHIFALLGVLPALAGSTVVDYTPPVPQVYIAAARFCITEDRSLRILSAAGLHDDDADLPTWVPDWREGGLRRLWVTESASTYHAAENTVPVILPFPDRNVLRLRGIFVGVLVRVQQANQFGHSWKLRGRPLDLSTSTQTRTSARSLSVPICNTLCFISTACTHRTDSGGLTSPPPSPWCGDISIPDWRLPESKTPGDIVVVLFGGPIPFLLRPKRPISYGYPEPNPFFCYFVGECPVAGLMDGEALSLSKQSWFGVTEFYLS